MLTLNEVEEKLLKKVLRQVKAITVNQLDSEIDSYYNKPIIHLLQRAYDNADCLETILKGKSKC